MLEAGRPFACTAVVSERHDSPSDKPVSEKEVCNRVGRSEVVGLV